MPHNAPTAEIDAGETLTAEQERLLTNLATEFRIALQQADFYQGGIVGETLTEIWGAHLAAEPADTCVALRFEPRFDGDTFVLAACQPEIGGERVYAQNDGAVIRVPLEADTDAIAVTKILTGLSRLHSKYDLQAR